MDSTEFDIAPEVEDTQLVRLRQELHRMIGQSQLVEQLEADLAQAKKLLHEIRTKNVPDIMAEIQSDHFNFGGYEVKVEDFVSGSLPKDPEKKQKAIDLLSEYGADGLLKTELSLEFGKSQHNEAINLYHELQEQGYGAFINSTVHPMTLMSWAKQRLRDGEEIDLEALGLYAGKVAKLKVLKK